MTTIACIVNPCSGNGRTGKKWPQIERALKQHLGDPRAYMTEGPRHATELARRALDDGADLVISVGGDGTNNEVLNGLFDQGRPVNPAAAMTVIPGGTGGGLSMYFCVNLIFMVLFLWFSRLVIGSIATHQGGRVAGFEDIF